MEADMKYELKNIKTLNTHDGVAWTATVYKDGKRIGTAEDRGDGGSTWLYLDNRAEEDALVAWCAEASKNSGMWMAQYATETIKTHHVGGEKDGTATFELRFNDEMALAYLMEVADLDKRAKKNIIFRVPNGNDPLTHVDTHDTYRLSGQSMATATPPSIAQALVYITSKHSNAEVWDFRDHAWISASAMLEDMRGYLPVQVGA
jgi:hypothetical protein